MKNEKFEDMKKEAGIMGILFIASAVLGKIIFYNESISVVLRVVFSLFIMFIVPGYAVTLFMSKKTEFAERIVLGCALSLAVIGTVSYYLGLVGLNLKYHYILPLLMIAAGFYFGMNKK